MQKLYKYSYTMFDGEEVIDGKGMYCERDGTVSEEETVALLAEHVSDLSSYPRSELVSLYIDTVVER